MYKIYTSLVGIEFVMKLPDGPHFGKSPDNTDYQKFKHDIQNGVTLNDASGNPITGDALTTFISTLP